MRSGAQIYFFSGTGNSLYLARELKRRIPDTILTPIASMRTVKAVVPHSKKIGFCFPNHGGQIPTAMLMFIQKLMLEGDEYLFALVSSGGTGCNAFATINRVIRKKNLSLSGEFLVNVPSFNPKTDDVSIFPSKHDLDSFAKDLPQKLDRIAITVRHESRLTALDASSHQLPIVVEKFLAPLVLKILSRYPSFFKGYFYADSSCTGCGVCERVCQTERIKIHESCPKWNANILCYVCHACLTFCPVGAVQVRPSMKWAGSKTNENPRFKPPYASIEDMVRQKYESNYDN